jgi:hypothetical protein
VTGWGWAMMFEGNPSDGILGPICFVFTWSAGITAHLGGPKMIVFLPWRSAVYCSGQRQAARCSMKSINLHTSGRISTGKWPRRWWIFQSI